MHVRVPGTCFRASAVQEFVRAASSLLDGVQLGLREYFDRLDQDPLDRHLHLCADLSKKAAAPKKTKPTKKLAAKKAGTAKKSEEGQSSPQANLLASAAEAVRLESQCSCGSVDMDVVTIDPMSARCSNRSCRIPIHDNERIAAEIRAIDAVRALGVQRHELW